MEYKEVADFCRILQMISCNLENCFKIITLKLGKVLELLQIVINILKINK